MNILNTLLTTLSSDDRFLSEGKLLKNQIIESALKLDKQLIALLLSTPELQNIFFEKIDASITVFDKDKFIKFISNKEFLPDSYTAFKNKVGLCSSEDKYIKSQDDVVLAWPYKDCILEGGQDQEISKFINLKMVRHLNQILFSS
jgi:adenine-specific DNA-methyltransferase